MVYAAYFTGTGTTERIVSSVADFFDRDWEPSNFSLPASREKPLVFQSRDIVILGMPVIAGRVPNLLVPYLNTMEGNGALAIPVVVYGNRNFDDALIELRDIMENRGFRTIAAGAFIGEHSFSPILAKGRPDENDLSAARELGTKVREMVETEQYSSPIDVPGTPYPYGVHYKPQYENGDSIDIRKVKPKTTDACNHCNLCAQICPMGAIDHEDESHIPGMCMKCCACEKRCPQGAKYFDDPGYLYHKQKLEELFAERREPAVFFSSKNK